MPQQLKLKGYRSVAEVQSIFNSYISVAQIDEIADDGMLISANEPGWPTDRKDYESFCSLIIDALAYHGVVNITLMPTP